MGKANYYEVLGVAMDVSGEEVRRAYHRLALKWHPDKHRGDDGTASRVFQRVSQAYETLGDPARRAEYDAAAEWDVNAMCLEDYLALFQNFTLTLNGMSLEMRGSSGWREWQPLEELDGEGGCSGGTGSAGRKRVQGADSPLLCPSPLPSPKEGQGGGAFI